MDVMLSREVERNGSSEGMGDSEGVGNSDWMSAKGVSVDVVEANREPPLRPNRISGHNAATERAPGVIDRGRATCSLEET